MNSGISEFDEDSKILFPTPINQNNYRAKTAN